MNPWWVLVLVPLGIVAVFAFVGFVITLDDDWMDELDRKERQYRAEHPDWWKDHQ